MLDCRIKWCVSCFSQYYKVQHPLRAYEQSCGNYPHIRTQASQAILPATRNLCSKVACAVALLSEISARSRPPFAQKVN